MHDSVRQVFVPFSKKFEGYVPWMYTDVKNLVTTGMNLIDPIAPPSTSRGATPRPARSPRRRKFRPPDRGEEQRAGGHRGREQQVSGPQRSPADDHGIQQLIVGNMYANDAVLNQRFPGFHAWPATTARHTLDGLGHGPNFHFPKFQAAASSLVPNFQVMAQERHNSGRQPWLKPRNAANAILSGNAQSALIKTCPGLQARVRCRRRHPARAGGGPGRGPEPWRRRPPPKQGWW